MSGDLIVRSLSQWEDAIGAEVLNKLISAFSCPLNPEVESFLKNKAVQSAHLSASQSYLVCDLKTKNLVGYYTLQCRGAMRVYASAVGITFDENQTEFVKTLASAVPMTKCHPVASLKMRDDIR